MLWLWSSSQDFVKKLIIDEKKDFRFKCKLLRKKTHQIEFDNIEINSYEFNEEKFDNSIKDKNSEEQITY